MLRQGRYLQLVSVIGLWKCTDRVKNVNYTNCDESMTNDLWLSGVIWEVVGLLIGERINKRRDKKSTLCQMLTHLRLLWGKMTDKIPTIRTGGRSTGVWNQLRGIALWLRTFFSPSTPDLGPPQDSIQSTATWSTTEKGWYLGKSKA